MMVGQTNTYTNVLINEIYQHVNQPYLNNRFVFTNLDLELSFINQKSYITNKSSLTK